MRRAGGKGERGSPKVISFGSTDHGPNNLCSDSLDFPRVCQDYELSHGPPDFFESNKMAEQHNRRSDFTEVCVSTMWMIAYTCSSLVNKQLRPEKRTRAWDFLSWLISGGWKFGGDKCSTGLPRGDIDVSEAGSSRANYFSSTFGILVHSIFSPTK